MPRQRIFACLAGVLTAIGVAAEPGYRLGIEKWRQEVEKRLQTDDGWLTVTGLFWLKEGSNRVGASPANEIRLPAGSAPERLGTFELRDGKTIFQTQPGAKVTVNGRPVAKVELGEGEDGSPVVIAAGDLSMFVIRRGSRTGIRLKDKNSKFRREFTGLRWSHKGQVCCSRFAENNYSPQCSG